MRKLLTTLLLLAVPLAVAADAQCPINGITTTDVGTGTGFLAPSVLNLGFDSATCELLVFIDAPSCCNTFLASHFVGIGSLLLPAPVPLRGPFLPGSELLILPNFIFGPSAGATSTIPVPPSPTLIGQTFVGQAVPVFFTTIGFSTDLAVTQAVQFTFN